MSFREKSAWVMGALTLAAGLYYLHIGLAASRELGWAAPPVMLFMPFTVLVIVASIVAQALLAILTPKEANAPADERERPLLDRAGNWSGLVLAAGAVTSLIFFIRHQDGALLFHGVMASLIVSQVAEYGLQVMLLRRHG